MNIPKEAVVLAGGLGTRLKGLTQNMPKPMLSVGSRPFLEHVIVRLKKQGVERVILAVAYLADQMAGYFKDGGKWGLEILYSDPQGRQLGTGGSIKEAEDLIQGDCFFAMNGDVYFNAELARLWEFHSGKKARATLALARLENKGRYGSVQLGKDGLIEAFLEKTKVSARGPSLINAGIYVFSRNILKDIPKDTDFSLEQGLFPKLARKSLYGLEFPEAFFIDIGTPEDYKRAQEVLPPLLA